jgi:hypothetical protein
VTTVSPVPASVMAASLGKDHQSKRLNDGCFGA